MLDKAPPGAFFIPTRSGGAVNPSHYGASREGGDMPEEVTALETQEAAQAEDAPLGAGAENPTMEGSRTYTQEEFDAALEAAVKERTAGAVRERADRLNKQKRELSNANKGLEAQVEALTAELAELKQKEQTRALIAKVSEETGVPAEVLRGGTEEELRAHADSLKNLIEKPSAPYIGSDGFAAGKPEQRETDWLRAAITNC